MKYPEKMEARWAWHFDTLLALRDILTRVRDELCAGSFAFATPEASDPADRANDWADRDVFMAELNAEEVELNAIDAALQRLCDGTYGSRAKARDSIQPDCPTPLRVSPVPAGTPPRG